MMETQKLSVMFMQLSRYMRSGGVRGEGQLVVRDPTTQAELRRAKYVDGWHASTQRP